MRLIIARHGETEENKTGVLQGHLPGHLTQLGIEQAQKLALRLKDEKIDYIYSSDLARAADTAKEVAKYHPEAQFELMQELRERDLGRFAGKQKSELGLDDQTLVVASMDDDPSMESKANISSRTNRFVKNLIAQHPDDTVLLVGHSGINRNLISALTGEEFGSTPSQLNTSVNIFEIDTSGNCEIQTANCIKHLE